MPKTTKRGSAKPKAPRSAPKSKAKAAAKSKAASKPKPSVAKSAATRSRASKSSVSTSRSRKGGAIDPRILAAIGLALEDERVARQRAELLTQPLSAWVTSGRVRVSAR